MPDIPTEEECVAHGGHCWQESDLPRCYGDDPDYPVRVRFCKHCRRHEELAWRESRKGGPLGAKTGVEG